MTRMAHELALPENSHMLLADVIHFLPSPVFVKDRQHRWIMLNEAFASFFGTTPEAMLGKSDYDFFPEEEAAIFWEKDDLVFSSGKVNENEESFTDAQGIQRWVLTRKSAFRDASGAQILVGVITDLTERKRSEQALKQAMSKAEEAAEAKGQFLANMSHEIRTPINAMIGFNHLLLQTPLSAQQQDYLEHSQQAAEHLINLINGILDFSKIEAGQMVLAHTRFSLSQLCTEVLNMVTYTAEQKGLDLIWLPAPGLSEFYLGDRHRLEQILLNLVNNAVKFTDHGTVSLTVEATQTGLSFRVKDTGIGIPEEKKSMLFSAFSQLDASSTRSYGGTGLGLSICKHLVELMHGEIGVHSVEGEGSTFWIHLPLPTEGDTPLQTHFSSRFASAGPAVTQPPKAMHSGQAAPQLRHKRILLVEDNLINQRIAREWLEIKGLQVDLSNNGQAALQQLEQANYDLIFMDLHMPVLDGLSATEAIRKHLKHKDIPIIALTADVLPKTREKALEAGMDDMITKPLHPQSLDQILQKWLLGPHKDIDRTQIATSPVNVQVPELHYFDYASPLYMLGGDTASYLQLLQDFEQDLQAELVTLGQALAQHDWSRAEEKIHRIKGAASTLGVRKLEKAAKKLEWALRTQKYQKGLFKYLEAVVLEFNKQLSRTIVRQENRD